MHLIHAKKIDACVITKKIMLENHTSACNHIELGGEQEHALTDQYWAVFMCNFTGSVE